MGRRKNKGKNRDREEEDGNSKILTSLTADILGEVLFRLNPPELLKLKCVSKSFRNFIGQPEFGAHYYRAGAVGKGITGLLFQNKEPKTREWMLSKDRYKGYWRRSYDLVRFSLVEPKAGKLPDPTLKFSRQGTGDLDIIDSCNGLLFCIFNKKVNKDEAKSYKLLFVCNPLTKEKISVSYPGKQSRGVGFALAADLDGDFLKYKVLCLRTKTDGDKSILSVFCSETGEWSEVCNNLPGATSNFEHSSPRVFFKGSLYWDCFKDHTLVVHLNPTNGQPCYEVMEAPMAAEFGRSLWKSDEKLHCYCHGVEQEVAEWTLCLTKDGPEWKNEFGNSDRFRNLMDAISKDERFYDRTKFKIISYDPQSDTLFLFESFSYSVYSYQCSNRFQHEISCMMRYTSKNIHHPADLCVLGYTHNLVHIQKAKTDTDAPKGQGDSDKVRGRRNRRTPRCQDFCTDD